MKHVTQLAVAIVSVFIGSLQAQPVIVSQPASTNVALGSNFTVQVVASSVTNIMAYQWWFTNSTWTNVSTFGTNDNYTVTNATYTNSGQYWVIVSNSPSSVATSTQAIVNVWAKPTITTNPVSQILATNKSATLTVGASGSNNVADGNNPLWYQWFNGTNSLGAASTDAGSNTYTWTGPATNYTGTYSVVVTNAVGKVTSSNAIVEFVEAPRFTNTPTSTVYLATSTNYTIRSAATGKYMSYQWYKGASALDSETNATLALINVTAYDNGAYTNTASNLAGAVTNAGTRVIVYDPPTITVQPVGSTNFGTNISGGATISVTAIGGGNLGFAWSVGSNFLGNGTTINSDTNAGIITATNTFTIPGLAVTNGTYTVTVTNEVGKVTSDGTVVQIVNLPVIITQPVSNITITAGSSYTLSVALTNASSQLLSYQWYYTNASTNGVYTNIDSRTIEGAISSTLALTNVDTTNTPGTYWVIVSNPAGTVTSSNAVIGVQFAPIITGIVATNSVPGLLGTSNYFSAGVGTNTALTVAVDATSSNPMVYQWLNGTNILRTITNSSHTDSYTVVGTVSNYSGAYSVVVSNLVGKASTNVTVTFVEPPGIPANQPADAGALVGGSVTFSVACTNAATSMLTYQWYRTNASYPVVGFTNSSLTVTNIQTNSAGIYFVKVNNPANQEATSRFATLTVQTMPAISQQPTNTVVAVGTSLTNYVGATGGLLSYQWRNGTNLVLGATNGLLVIPNAQTTNSGSYTVSITNAAGKVTSAPPAVVWVVAPPVIVTNPSTAAVIKGQDHTFVVTVANATNSLLSYQWYYNTNDLRATPANGLTDVTNAVPGRTNDSYYLANVDPVTNGYYAVVVSNIAGVVTSTVAKLTVQVVPTITNQPLGTNIAVSSNATLTVVAGGTSIRYQWYKDNQIVANSNASTFTFTSAQITNSGVYSVVVTNLVGSVTSSNAVVWVVAPPGIATQPSNAVALLGASTNFTVVCSNADTSLLNYQWWYSNTASHASNAISGATSSSYNISSIGTNNGGGYFVIVTNVAGKATSEVATLTVLTVPTIWQQPTNTAVAVGTNLTNYVGATGGLLGYQWRNGTNLVLGATNALLVITNAQTTNSGNYTVIITNTVGTVTSDPPAVVWVVAPPVITNSPSTAGAIPGDDHTFVVAVSNAANSLLSYQWYFNATILTQAGITAPSNAVKGQVFDSYYLSGVYTNDNGYYAVVVTNLAGAATSTVAQLMVQVPPVITLQPEGTNIGLNSNATLTVTASGDSLQYQWYKGTNAVAGSNTSTFAINSAQYTDAGTYYVAVTNFSGSTNSAAVVVNVVDYPVIVTQPSSVEVAQGANATFTVVVTNVASSLLSYQWNLVTLIATNPIVGEVSSNLVVHGVTTNSEGTYMVSIASARGTTNSANATLTMLNVPAIRVQPHDTNVVLGTNLTLTVDASGGGSPSYQWWRTNSSGTSNLNNNAATYTIPNAPLSAAGAYYVVVSNSLGKVTSSNAFVQVVSKPGIAIQPLGTTNQVGTEYTFTVTASPTNLVAVMFYQWYTNSVAITGATNSSYYITSLRTNDTASYTVVITNIAGSVTSSAAILVAQSTPLITSQPQGAIVAVGGSVTTLSVSTNGDGLGYQWYKNGVPVSGSNSYNYYITTAVTNDTATYYVLVTNLVGSDISVPVTVTVVSAPNITQPASGTNVIGNYFTFRIGLDSSNAAPTIHFQWRKGTNAIAGATDTNKYTILGTTFDDVATNYNVLVWNIAGTNQSSNATLSVDAPPGIASQSGSTNIVYPGGSSVLQVLATTNHDLVYQWYKGTNKVSSSNGVNFTVFGTELTNSDTYTVIITNLAGSITSTGAVVNVVTNAQILTGPASQILPEWTNATFSVTLANPSYAFPSYQWLKGGIPIAGATSSNLVLTSISVADEAGYSVVVSNITKGATSAVANLTVETMPAIISGPVSTNLATNGVIVLNVTASGKNLKYQWWKDSTNMVQPFSTTSAFTTNTSAKAVDSGTYTVIVSNDVDSVVSAGAVVTVIELPVFTVDLTTNDYSFITYNSVTNVLAVESGGSFAIGVTVTNVPESLLNYQWYFTNAGSTNTLGGEVSDTYALGGLAYADQGGYFVVVTNLAGAATSAVAQLVVLLTPSVANIQSTNFTNGPFSLTANATGDDIGTNWYKASNDSLIMSGILTNSTPALASFISNDFFYVEVTNAVGSARSTNFFIAIIDVPTVELVPPTNNYIKADGATTYTLVTTNLTGGGAMTYQWWTNFGNGFGLDDSNGPSYTVSASFTGFTNSYYVVVTNLAGTNISKTTNTVIGEMPITNFVASFSGTTNVAKTSNLVMSVAVTNADALVYQWYKNGVSIVNSNGTNLTLNNLGINDSGSYTVSVSNHVSFTSSVPVVVKVVAAPSILTQPKGGALLAGSNYTFSVVCINGTNSLLSYQWFWTTNTVTSSNAMTLDINNVTNTLSITTAGTNWTGKYWVVVTNVAGVITSSIVDLNVQTIPQIDRSTPTNTVMAVGKNLTNPVTATGEGLTYKWLKGAANLPFLTTSNLIIQNAQVADSGAYTVIVTNYVGSDTYTTNVLVVAAPVIISQPQSRTLTNNSEVTFRVVVTNADISALTYSWYKTNGSGGFGAALGGNSNTYTIGHVTNSDSGGYVVTVSNVANVVTSLVATLWAESLPTVTTPVLSGVTLTNGAISTNHSFTLIVTNGGDNSGVQYWSKDGVPMPGETKTNYDVLIAAITNSGSYTVTVTNHVGTVTSSNYVVNVVGLPVIGFQPLGATIATNGAYTLSVGVSAPTNASLFTNQWYHSGVVITGATNSFYRIGTASTIDAGNYYVSVTDVAGTTTSSNATMVVIASPVITTNLTGTTNKFGIDLKTNLIVAATGGGTNGGNLKYLWYYNGGSGDTLLPDSSHQDQVDPDSGVGTSTVTNIPSAQTTNSGSYFVVVTNIAGSVTSSIASVLILTNPVIALEPKGSTNKAGTTYTFTVLMSNAASSVFSYQWYKMNYGSTNYTNLVWNTNTLRLSSLAGSDAGGYYVIVTNLAGAATSQVARLSVQATPVVTDDLFATNFAVGSNLNLSIGTIAVGGVYRWTKDNTNVSLTRTNVHVEWSDTNAALWITNAQTSDSGIYKVYITNSVGPISSASVRVWVVAKPGISVQPANGVGTEGLSYTFNVGVSNAATSALSYQWLGTNGSISGIMTDETNSYLTLPNLTSTNTGTYCVVVTNVAGSITSRVATLTVMGKPKFDSQPVSTNLPVGSNLVLSATVYGGYVNFTWRKGTNILSATNSTSATNLDGSIISTLTLSNAQITYSTNYNVSVTNSLGGITSTNAAVLVVASPQFQTNLAASVYVGAGSNYTFSVTMTNAAKSALTYQWAYTNVGGTSFTGIDGAISNRYVWLAGGDVGGYRVVVTNVAGAVTSTVSLLGVTVGPSIITQPLVGQSYATNLATNGTITMSVVATNGGNFIYQWKKDGKIVPVTFGGTNDALSITNARLTNAGVYSVTVSNAAGYVSSLSATVNVLTLPAFQIRPVGATNLSGATNKYAFSVTMSNAANSYLSYQWRSNGVALANGTNVFVAGTNTIYTGATNNVFTIIGLTTNNSADYTVVVTNLAGSVTSSVAKLFVQDGVQITTNLTNIYVALKDVSAASLTVGASGSALRYQWFKNATAINHATNATLLNTTLPTANMGITKAGSNNYYVVVSNRVNSVKSSNVAVVVVAPPGIQTQPKGKDMVTNTTYIVTVVASNAALSRLSYQWYTNTSASFTGAGTPAGVSTNSTYNITNGATVSTNWYSVVVTNIAGSVTSSWVKMGVFFMPTITTQPTNIFVTNGASAVLNVANNGGGTYQWFKNGTALKGFNVDNLNFTSAVVTNSGVYYVVISNVVGSVKSSNAVLTVVTNPVFVTSLSNVVVALGSNYTFRVVMTNATNSYIGYRYQWFKPGGIVWEGAFTNTAPLLNVGYADQGTYQVVVTNVCGLASTSSATLTVQAKPVITQQPTPVTQTITNGMDFTITVVATGDGLVYQWSKKRGTTTTIVKDATNSSLTISAAVSTNSGAYSVVISNMVGKVTSSNAQVNIWQKNGTTWVKYTLSGGSATNVSETVSNASSSASMAGDYTGLFVAANGVPTHQTAGLLIVSVTSGGAYSGKLLLGGDVVGLSGQLDASGNSVAEFERPGKSALTVTLTANAASKQLTGSVSAAGWTSALIADRSVFSIANPAPTAGEYALVIPATQPADGLSATGYALVSANGAITFVGTTSEGLSISQSTTVSKDGYWPFYVPDADGEIIGWLQFINGEPFGTLNWINSTGTGTTVSEVIGTGPTK